VKRRVRRKPHSVLDQLESDGVVDGLTVENLRQLASPKRKPGPLSDREVLDLRMLLHAVMQPARADTRRANERDYALASRRAYFESIGEDAATLRTAQEWGVSRRTVTNAALKFRIDMKRDSTRVPELSKSLKAAREQIRKPRVGNKGR
jgi:hypothetical protein